MPLFSKVFKSKDANKKVTTSNGNSKTDTKPQWIDSWLRTRVDPEEVVELLHGCTQEIKSRALDVPFLLLPFRPSSDPSAARTFVRNYFIPPNDRPKLKGNALINELRMTEVMVIISVMKWCWARLPGGVVSWETYKMFKIGEKDCKYARDSFQHFLPISVNSKARIGIINDFFDLLAALAAHSKTNGLGGYKLSRYAGWWAFDHYDSGKGFEAGYKAWSSAADATCHLFFAYLRSLSPEPGKTNGILDLPRSLQQLLALDKYPPVSSLVSNDTIKVVMVVDVVSPTPYALLRRAKNFEYRDDDYALQQFADYEDPVSALTDECRRVLRAISTTNESHVSDAKTSTSLIDPSWSRFEDIGFSSALDDIGEDDKGGMFSFSTFGTQGLSTTSRSQVVDLNRPTTPSWADFMSSGFTDEKGNKTTAPILLPPDKMLPPIISEPRGQSSQSHRRDFETSSALEPGELASITKINIDDSFWWVWITSLAGEEPTSRKACFGRCAVIETSISGGEWMVMEEQVKGSAPEPVQGAYIAEKKSFLGFSTKRGKLGRRRSAVKKSPLAPNGMAKSDFDPANVPTLAPDQQAKIQRAAQELANKKQVEETEKLGHNRRGRFDDPESRTNSIFTLGPHIKAEASPALQWAKQYDKNEIRAQYLGNQLAGRGSSDLLTLPQNGLDKNRSTTTLPDPNKEKELPIVEKDLPIVPKEEPNHSAELLSRSAVQAPVVESPPLPVHEAVPAPVLKPDMVPPQPTVEATPEVIKSNVPVINGTSPEAARTISHPVESEPKRLEALPEARQESSPLPPPSVSESTKVRAESPENVRNKSFQSDSALPQRPNGIRRLFGTMRKGKDDSAAVPPPAPMANPAVAAARRALESKINPPNPTPVPNNFAKYKAVRTPIASAAIVTTVPEPAPVKATEFPEPITAPAPAPVPETTPTPALAPASEVSREAVSVPLQKDIPPIPVAEIPEHRAVQTRRDAEFDELSRIDTREREHADQEFSRFDQGPLLEQPAEMPMDYPHENNLSNETEHASKHQSVYSAVTMPVEDTDDDSEDDDERVLSQEVSANDRWAQIRRNAAERAARFSDDHGTRSRTETRTDDGDTSGEETIESRVARIKARVAELTGNMEGVRR